MEYLDDISVRACMYLGDVYRLRPFLRKTRVRLVIEHRYGLPFFLRQYRARKAYVLIFFAAVAGIMVLSTRIWRIDITGNSSLGEETILEYLDSRNIRYGVKKSSIDNDALELSLRRDFNEVIWASVYEQGTRLVVSVQEKLVTDRGPERGEGCTDLVADRDATVLSIITRSGTPQVTAGTEVKKGDILVCGRQKILNDNGDLLEYYYRSADADVIGSVVYEYEDWIETNVRIRQFTGRETRQYYVSFGTWQFKFPPLFADYDDYETLETVEQLVLMDSFYLPVFYGQIRQMEQTSTAYVLTEQEAREQALFHLEQYICELEENGVHIFNKHVMIEKSKDRYHVYGEISASEKIGRRVPTEMLQQPSGRKAATEE